MTRFKLTPAQEKYLRSHHVGTGVFIMLTSPEGELTVTEFCAGKSESSPAPGFDGAFRLIRVFDGKPVLPVEFWYESYEIDADPDIWFHGEVK